MRELTLVAPSGDNGLAKEPFKCWRLKQKEQFQLFAEVLHIWIDIH